MTFLGLDRSLWSRHRRTVQVSNYDTIKAELERAEGALVNALAYSSKGRYKLDVRDRETLMGLIDELRNYMDHVTEEY